MLLRRNTRTKRLSEHPRSNPEVRGIRRQGKKPENRWMSPSSLLLCPFPLPEPFCFYNSTFNAHRFVPPTYVQISSSGIMFPNSVPRIKEAFFIGSLLAFKQGFLLTSSLPSVSLLPIFQENRYQGAPPLPPKKRHRTALFPQRKNEDKRKENLGRKRRDYQSHHHFYDNLTHVLYFPIYCT